MGSCKGKREIEEVERWKGKKSFNSRGGTWKGKREIEEGEIERREGKGG